MCSRVDSRCVRWYVNYMSASEQNVVSLRRQCFLHLILLVK
jgi:hypothetical protein